MKLFSYLPQPYKQIHWRWLMILLLAGCATPPASVVETDRLLMWPPAPAPARIAFEKSIRQPADLGFRRRWWKRASDYILGSDYRESVFIKPSDLCLDEDGNLCVADTGSSTVWFFDIQRKRYNQWDRIGKVTFSSPVAVAKHNNTLYVADSALGAVIAFSTKGKFLFSITEELGRPSDLVIDDQTLWVADAGNHRVMAFDLQGRKIGSFGSRGVAAGEFNYPTHLAKSDGDGSSLYITDAMNFRVQEIDRKGHPIQSIGTIGNVTGSFSRPKGVATDSEGNIYIVDALFDNVQIFDKQGRFLMHWGENGAEPGRFWLPTGIAIDADDRIWVADSYNRRIQVFKRVGDHEGI